MINKAGNTIEKWFISTQMDKLIFFYLFIKIADAYRDNHFELQLSYNWLNAMQTSLGNLPNISKWMLIFLSLPDWLDDF